MKLYVGNLSKTVEEAKLKELFSELGDITSFVIVRDKHTGLSKGFGFVEFSTQKAGEAAVSKFDGYDFDGKNLKVNESRSKNNYQSLNKTQ